MVFEVAYDVGDGIYSVNMIEADDFQKCWDEAHAHAKRYGYSVSCVENIPDWKVAENRRKGMPLKKV